MPSSLYYPFFYAPLTGSLEPMYSCNNDFTVYDSAYYSLSDTNGLYLSGATHGVIWNTQVPSDKTLTFGCWVKYVSTAYSPCRSFGAGPKDTGMQKGLIFTQYNSYWIYTGSLSFCQVSNNYMTESNTWVYLNWTVKCTGISNNLEQYTCKFYKNGVLTETKSFQYGGGNLDMTDCYFTIGNRNSPLFAYYKHFSCFEELSDDDVLKLYQNGGVPYETRMLISDQSLQNIAAAIRTKNGLQSTYLPSEMPAAIRALPENTINNCLRFVAIEDNSSVAMESNLNINLKYSTDMETWTTWSSVLVGNVYMFPSITLSNKGDCVWICGNNSYLGNTSGNSSIFVMTGKIAAYGSIMYLLAENGSVKSLTYNNIFYKLFYNCKSLIIPPELPAETITANCYAYMFYGCTNLTVAPELPAKTLANQCYTSMFYNCESLTTAPELPAETLASNCYADMFHGCTNLTVAPELPAKTLTPSCYVRMFSECINLKTAPELPAKTIENNSYNEMFSYCSNLTMAPELPAETLNTYCYAYMFQFCTNLTSAPELPAKTLASNCYLAMFNGCAGLTEAPELPAETLASGCYRGMFQNCINLVTAPELPVTTLEPTCYSNMFYGCIRLTSAPELPAETLAFGCYSGMFQNCSSLVTAPDLPATTMETECYISMFQECIRLTTAPELNIDTTANYCCRFMFQNCSSLVTVSITFPSMVHTGCYQSMFSGCSKLTTAPALPALTLADSCYSQMFRNCTQLTVAPELPATTLANNCYTYMFYACSNLTTVTSELPATESTDNCYNAMFSQCAYITTSPDIFCSPDHLNCFNTMFSSCSRLTYIKVRSTSWNTSYAQSWVSGVASSGTFVKPSGTTITSGTSGIPNNWTVQNV